MAVIKTVRLETEHALWRIEIKDRPDGYECEYFGTTPKYAQAVDSRGMPTMADMGRGKTLGKDVDKLLADTIRTIESIDGPIIAER